MASLFHIRTEISAPAWLDTQADRDAGEGEGEQGTHEVGEGKWTKFKGTDS